MMTWFGTDWGAPLNRECVQVPTPVGTPCLRCTEPIEEGEDGVIDSGGGIEHYECFMRGIVGSVNHQMKRCRCYGFPEDDDASDWGPREDALAALRFFEENARRGRP